MSDILPMLLVFASGLVLGTIFYAGLWWTVKKGLTSNYAPLWFTASLWSRLAIAIVGFYVIGQGDWKRFFVCLVGFIIARIAVTLLTKDPRHAA
ncbi:ATP synthase subunit I [Rickettsiales bacterium]|nr:ATP synthase subunit I [Rickettsiales bacterium]